MANSRKIQNELKKLGLPTHRRPSSIGDIIKEDFLKPLQLTQSKLAENMNISKSKLNRVLLNKSRVTADIAIRLNKVLGGSLEFWLELQQSCDIYDAVVNFYKKTIILSLKI